MEIIVTAGATIAVAVISAIVAFLGGKAVRDKAPTETVEILANATAVLLEPLTARVNELESRLQRMAEEHEREVEGLLTTIANLEKENGFLLRWIAALVEQVRQRGGSPIGIEEIRKRDQ